MLRRSQRPRSSRRPTDRGLRRVAEVRARTVAHVQTWPRPTCRLLSPLEGRLVERVTVIPVAPGKEFRQAQRPRCSRANDSIFKSGLPNAAGNRIGSPLLTTDSGRLDEETSRSVARVPQQERPSSVMAFPRPGRSCTLYDPARCGRGLSLRESGVVAGTGDPRQSPSLGQAGLFAIELCVIARTDKTSASAIAVASTRSGLLTWPHGSWRSRRRRVERGLASHRRASTGRCRPAEQRSSTPRGRGQAAAHRRGMRRSLQASRAGRSGARTGRSVRRGYSFTF